MSGKVQNKTLISNTMASTRKGLRTLQVSNQSGGSQRLTRALTKQESIQSQESDLKKPISDDQILYKPIAVKENPTETPNKVVKDVKKITPKTTEGKSGVKIHAKLRKSKTIEEQSKNLKRKSTTKSKDKLLEEARGRMSNDRVASWLTSETVLDIDYWRILLNEKLQEKNELITKQDPQLLILKDKLESLETENELLLEENGQLLALVKEADLLKAFLEQEDKS